MKRLLIPGERARSFRARNRPHASVASGALAHLFGDASALVAGGAPAYCFGDAGQRLGGAGLALALLLQMPGGDLAELAWRSLRYRQ